MKRLAIGVLLGIATLIGVPAPAAKAVEVNVTIGGFYDELAPYGRWVECNYGRCWVPSGVASDWQPYSNGQWIYTEYGWTWVSNDPWGGNPYHYGTWASIEGYGWSWIPGTVWAPAWVTWSYSDNYVGWAPLPPNVGFGASGYAGRPIVVSQGQYVFVPSNRFIGRNVASVRIPANRSVEIFRQTKPVTGFGVSGGIVRNNALPMEAIERASGSRIERRTIQSAGTAPRAVSAGARLAVVAPASEVKAAASARPQAISRPNESSREEPHGRAPADHESRSVKPPKADTAQPPNSHHAAAAPPPDPHRAAAAPPPDAHHTAAAPPAEHRPAPPRPAEANRPPEHGPKPKPTGGKEKQVEKDKKPEGEGH